MKGLWKKRVRRWKKRCRHVWNFHDSREGSRSSMRDKNELYLMTFSCVCFLIICIYKLLVNEFFFSFSLKKISFFSLLSSFFNTLLSQMLKRKILENRKSLENSTKPKLFFEHLLKLKKIFFLIFLSTRNSSNLIKVS